MTKLQKNCRIHGSLINNICSQFSICHFQFLKAVKVNWLPRVQISSRALCSFSACSICSQGWLIGRDVVALAVLCSHQFLPLLLLLLFLLLLHRRLLGLLEAKLLILPGVLNRTHSDFEEGCACVLIGAGEHYHALDASSLS